MTAADGGHGEVVTRGDGRSAPFAIRTTCDTVSCGLQRVGRLVWREERTEPYQLCHGRSPRTLLSVLVDGALLDLTEPAKAKRITVALFAGPW